MTLNEFNNLKVKDRVFLHERSGKYISTEVLKIDRYFKKLTVLLGRQSYSYKYIQKEVPREKQSGQMVGICPPINWEEKWKEEERIRKIWYPHT